MTDASWRRAARAAAVVGLALVTASCVSIPTSSPVREGRAVGPEDDPQQVRINVTGPSPGADREAIVEGFYQAMLAYPQNVPVAREYLTTQAAADWDPGASVVVYQDIDTISTGRPSTVSVVGRALGSVDDRGAWTSSVRPEAVIRTSLRLRQVGGEWRITNPEPGIFIDPDYFERNYDPYSLYFFDPTRQVLTPDPVYLAAGDTTATALIGDLLLGPTDELRGVGETIADTATEIDVAVAVSADGVAEIPLSDNVLRLSPEERALFAAQLTWTMRQVTGVSAISVSVEGAPLEIPNVDQTISVDEYAGFDPAGISGERRLFAFGEDGTMVVDDGAVSAVSGPLGTVRPGASLGIDPLGELGAVVSPDRSSVVVGGLPSGSTVTPQTWFSGGTRLLRPSWDRAGVLWLVDRAADGAHIYAVTAGGSQEIRAPGLTGADILSFAVSHDGVRFAAVVDRGRSSLVRIAMVDRSAQDDTTVHLERPRTVRVAEINLSDITQLAWASPSSLAVLGNEQDADRQPIEMSIDGSRTLPAQGFLPVPPTTIAAFPDPDVPLAVGSADGTLYLQALGSWVPISGGPVLRAPVYPG